MSAHSFFPPSGAAAWAECAMWPTMNQRYPQDDTPESKEGNTAHWVAWEMVAGRFHNEGTVAPNGVIVTEEMIEGAELVIETVNTRLPGMQLHIEQRVDIPAVHKGCWGTPDIWVFDQAKFALDVIDYKFGHRFVDEFENKQGIAYISGLLDHISNMLNIPVGQLDSMIMVNFTIVQPRCFYKGKPVRTWSIRAEELRGYINKLHNAAYRADPSAYPIPEATTNIECMDCPGRHACAALQEAAYSDTEYAVQSSPVELPPDAAGLELRIMERALERLQSRVEGMREYVGSLIRQGKLVPLYKTEQGFGRTQWTVPPEQVLALGNLMGVDLSKQGVKTPGQAKKSGIDEAVISAYSVTPKGEIKLIPVNLTDARRVFGQPK